MIPPSPSQASPASVRNSDSDPVLLRLRQVYTAVMSFHDYVLTPIRAYVRKFKKDLDDLSPEVRHRVLTEMKKMSSAREFMLAFMPEHMKEEEKEKEGKRHTPVVEVHPDSDSDSNSESGLSKCARVQDVQSMVRSVFEAAGPRVHFSPKDLATTVGAGKTSIYNALTQLIVARVIERVGLARYALCLKPEEKSSPTPSSMTVHAEEISTRVLRVFMYFHKKNSMFKISVDDLASMLCEPRDDVRKALNELCAQGSLFEIQQGMYRGLFQATASLA